MNLQEAKIIIKLRKNRSHKIEIMPFLWVLFPNVRSFTNSAKGGLISILEFTKMARQDKPEYKQKPDRVVNRLFGTTYVIEWLCFNIHIGLFSKSEVGEIYPKTWSFEKYSWEQNLEKWKKLELTGYYHNDND